MKLLFNYILLAFFAILAMAVPIPPQTQAAALHSRHQDGNIAARGVPQVGIWDDGEPAQDGEAAAAAAVNDNDDDDDDWQTELHQSNDTDPWDHETYITDAVSA